MGTRPTHRMSTAQLLVLLSVVAHTQAHGHITIPASTRHGGSLSMGGDCSAGECFWFSNMVTIPQGQKQTLPEEARTIALNISSGSPDDFWARNPWRAPGTATVLGHGCGNAGGGPVPYANGGNAPPSLKQGQDGLTLPEQPPVVWRAGTAVDVAYAMTANHGGGYSWRLCKNNNQTEVTEECFQRTQLKFAEDKSWLIYTNGQKVEIPFSKVTIQGAEWAKDPVPGCYICLPQHVCGRAVPATSGKTGTENTTCWQGCLAANKTALSKAGCNKQIYYPKCIKAQSEMCGFCGGMNMSDWEQQQICYAGCDGGEIPQTSCPAGLAQFPEPLPGISGWPSATTPAWNWSIANKMAVPADLEKGKYLLSWRWDCEQNLQIWQNCADVLIV